MTPQEALNLVKQVTDRFLGTKADHENLTKAIEVLKEAIAPKTEG